MEKIKLFITSEKGKDILVVMIVILTSLMSFELGRLSKSGNEGNGVKIEYEDQNNFLGNTVAPADSLRMSANAVSAGKNFFASSRGKKYYTISCSAGKTIKQENRIYFATGEEAQAAGYELSGSCD